MNKLTAETLYDELIKARIRYSAVQSHLNDLEETTESYLTHRGSGAVPLRLPVEVVRKLLEDQESAAAWAVRDLEKKVEIVNKMLEELGVCQ